jgi:hypothetical protein
VVKLQPVVLDDPDVVPLALERPVAGRLPAEWVPQARTAKEEKDALRVDADGDGEPEARVAAAKPRVVEVTLGGRTLPLLIQRKGAAWLAAPAAALRGSSGGLAVTLLDADLDGDFAGAKDHVRVGAGAFMPHPEDRRLAGPEGTFRYEVRKEGAALVFVATPEPRPEGASDAAWRGLLAVNAFRNGIGLPPLALDAERSAGCQAHAEYIRLNPADGFGHDEIPGRPAFSEKGREAAIESVMERTGDPAVALERLVKMMVHRTPFLCDPGPGVGVGAVGSAGEGASPTRFGPPGYSVLRAGKALVSRGFPVVVPGPGARDVPIDGLPELPEPEVPKGAYGSPRGYPVSVSFLGPARRAARVTLRLASRPEPIPGFVYTPAAPVHPSVGHNYDTAFFLPERPLQPGTTYVAEFQAGEGADATTLVWRFTTTRSVDGR